MKRWLLLIVLGLIGCHECAAQCGPDGCAPGWFRTVGPAYFGSTWTEGPAVTTSNNVGFFTVAPRAMVVRTVARPAFFAARPLRRLFGFGRAFRAGAGSAGGYSTYASYAGAGSTGGYSTYSTYAGGGCTGGYSAYYQGSGSTGGYSGYSGYGSTGGYSTYYGCTGNGRPVQPDTWDGDGEKIPVPSAETKEPSKDVKAETDSDLDLSLEARRATARPETILVATKDPTEVDWTLEPPVNYGKKSPTLLVKSVRPPKF